MGMCRFEAWGEVQSGCKCDAWILLYSTLLCPLYLLKTVSVCTVQLSVCLSMRSGCGYGCVGIHRRLQNSRPPLSPTQLVVRSSLHP